tara:strand:+ start:136 stop:309 length:174 start_codon:yes stop_codon:yes gene_type:complete
MKNSEYIEYYKKKIGQYTELMYNASQNANITQFTKYEKERDVLVDGLAQLERQEAIS